MVPDVIELKSTLRDVPIRLVLYGADGVGKTTFCAGAPGAVFIPVEEGLDNIDALATPRPETWAQLIEYTDALVDDSRCKSIVIDSIDEAEQLCWAHTCVIGDDKGKKKNIEAFGYGKGYVAALGHWRGLLASLERAGQAGKNVLLIAHAHRKSVKNPSGEDYEQWQIKLNDKAASLFREWARIVGFAELEIATVNDVQDGGRTKGQWSGKRVLRTSPSAGYQGKTRLTLPAKIPLDWQAFAQAVAAGKPPSIDALASILNEKLVALDNDDVTKGCADFVLTRGRSLASLTEAIATVQGYLDEKNKESA